VWRFNTAVGDIKHIPTKRVMSPYYRFIPSDTELSPLTVGHNVNLNKLQAVLFCKKKILFFRGISYNSVCGHIPVQKEKYYIIRIKKWLF
jgi:hypothetical protein